MSFLSGSSDSSWQPVMTARTATSTYWLNWRVFLCTVWILVSLVFSIFLIRKREGFRSRDDDGDRQKETAGCLYEDEVWRPCLEGIHPGWLLGFRMVAFFVLFLLLIMIGLVDGATIFLYYTQWTFTSITIYFGLGSLLSLYGCYQHHKRVMGNKLDDYRLDTEQGTYFPTNFGRISISSNNVKDTFPSGFFHDCRPAGAWSYVFQIIFQINAGAVMLTDTVFWFVIVPFLAIKDYQLSFLEISMHTINAVFLLGDTALNSLRFPLFRIAYFFLWTVFYVIFQWILHACVSFWWPYPFLDLSSSFAPLWYLSVAMMHIPCYGFFVLIMKMKHSILSRWFPGSYQCAM